MVNANFRRVWLCLLAAFLVACTSDASYERDMREHQTLLVKIQDAEARAYSAYAERRWSNAESEIRNLLSLYNKSLQSNRTSEQARAATQYDIFIAYGRLAKSYRESGDLGKAQEVSEFALKNAPEKMREKMKTEADLNDFITSIDKNLKR